ncbi:MAG: hypothetical protein ABSD20_05470 [Terriglobales bacterium]|jgi:predicted transcriptional regulator
MNTEVYSWRLSRELKSDLQREARLLNAPISSVLERAVREWLQKQCAASSDEETQRRLHAAAESCIGTMAGNDPHRSENVRELVRKRLKERYGR